MSKLSSITLACILFCPNYTYGNTLSASSGTSLTQIISSAKSGDTIKITSSFTANSIEFSKDITLDLAGYKIEDNSANSPIISVVSGHLTIIDSSTQNTGKLVNSNKSSITCKPAIQITSSGKLTIKGGIIEGYYGINSDNDVSSSTVYIEGGKIHGYESAIDAIYNTTYYISGGEFTCDKYYTISVRETGNIIVSGNAKIFGGTSTSSVGVFNNGGTTHIYGGFFYANKAVSTHSPACKYSQSTTGNLLIHSGYFSESITPSSGYYCKDNTNTETKGTYPYHVLPTSFTVYNGSETSSTYTSNGTQWDENTVMAPNAITVVDEAFTDWASYRTNVLVKHTNNNTYTCKNFVLTDLSDFYTPYSFTAESATYTRSADKMHYYNSFCLPFAITSTDVNGKIYLFQSSDANNIYMQEQQNGIEAGTPCIIQSDNSGCALTISKSNVAVSKDIVNNGKLKGCYTSTTIGAEYYKLTDGTKDNSKFGKTSSNGKCSQFRSYLDLSNSTGAKEAISISWGDGTPTPISEIPENSSSYLVKECYTLSGQKTMPHKGSITIARTQDGRIIKYLTK